MASTIGGARRAHAEPTVGAWPGDGTPPNPTCRWVGPASNGHAAPEVARGSQRLHDQRVSVQKAIDLSGSGETIQDAVSEALDRARETLEGITRFEVMDISGVLEGPRTMYQVEIKVWFTVLERMHG